MTVADGEMFAMKWPDDIPVTDDMVDVGLAELASVLSESASRWRIREAMKRAYRVMVIEQRRRVLGEIVGQLKLSDEDKGNCRR